MKIILDTNFLVYCAEQKIDYLRNLFDLTDKHKIVVLSSVTEELEKLKNKARKASDREAASLALQILNNNIGKKKVKVIKTREKADKSIIKKATKKDVVATMDRELKSRLKGKARILSVRGRKLEIL